MNIINDVERVENFVQKNNPGQSSANAFTTIFYFLEFFVGVIILSVVVFFLPWITLGRGEMGLIALPLSLFLVAILPMVSGISVYIDSKKLKNLGANIESPLGWAAVSTLTYPVGLSIYLALRQANFKPQTIQNSIMMRPQINLNQPPSGV